MVIFRIVMNRMNRLFILVALSIAFTSCSKDEAGNANNKDFRMSMTVSDSSRDTKASVDENLPSNGGQLQVRWDKGDKIRMMVGSNVDDVVACDFSLIGGPSIGSGNFEYIGDKVETSYYYGIYPLMEIGINGEVQLNVPIDGTISQAASDDSHHLGQFRPMYASPVHNEDGGNVLNGVVFRHLTSLIIFKVTNSTNETFNLNSIELSTSDGNAVFYSSASFNPQSQTEAVVNGSPSEAVALGFDGNGMQVTPNEMEKAYLPVLPTGDFSESQLRVRAMTDIGEFITELPIAASQTLKRFEAGSYCIFNLKKTTTGITVEIELKGWENGEVVDVPI